MSKFEVYHNKEYFSICSENKYLAPSEKEESFEGWFKVNNLKWENGKVSGELILSDTVNGMIKEHLECSRLYVGIIRYAVCHPRGAAGSNSHRPKVPKKNHAYWDERKRITSYRTSFNFNIPEIYRYGYAVYDGRTEPIDYKVSVNIYANLGGWVRQIAVVDLKTFYFTDFGD